MQQPIASLAAVPETRQPAKQNSLLRSDTLPFLIVLAACLAVLVRDALGSGGFMEAITFFDSFLIIGIGWIPSALLLRLPWTRVRPAVYVAASLLALAWIVQHTPNRAIGPTAGAGTWQMVTAFCTAAFALLTARLAPHIGQRQGLVSPPWTRRAIWLSAWAVTGVLVGWGAIEIGRRWLLS